jgi:hypothetical protein
MRRSFAVSRALPFAAIGAFAFLFCVQARAETPDDAPFRETPNFGVQPTFAIGIGIRRDGYAQPYERSTIPIWAGVAVHPIEAAVSPFVSTGMEFELVANPAGALVTDYIPELRGGVQWGDTPASRLENRLLPFARFYTIGGYRIPNERHDGVFRVGAGISSPALLGAFAKTNCEYPIPTMVEAVSDMDPHTGTKTFSFRLGIEF